MSTTEEKSSTSAEPIGDPFERNSNGQNGDKYHKYKNEQNNSLGYNTDAMINSQNLHTKLKNIQLNSTPSKPIIFSETDLIASASKAADVNINPISINNQNTEAKKQSYVEDLKKDTNVTIENKNGESQHTEHTKEDKTNSFAINVSPSSPNKFSTSECSPSFVNNQAHSIRSSSPTKSNDPPAKPNGASHRDISLNSKPPSIIKAQSFDLFNDDSDEHLGDACSIRHLYSNKYYAVPTLNLYHSPDQNAPKSSRIHTDISVSGLDEKISATTSECTPNTLCTRDSLDSNSSSIGGYTTDSSHAHSDSSLNPTQSTRQGTCLPPTTKTLQSLDSRPIYPNVPYSPYASPYGSPRSNRRRTPLRESRRISIEKSGSFLQLNQYKLMDQIGQGSYGLVKLAYSEEDSTHYAMKILSKKRLLRKAGLMGRGPKKTTSPLDRVYREIAVLKKLDHPNVVKLVEVLDDPLEDSLYLVFELVQQGEVLSIPTDKPLNEERAWSVFRDTLQGLEYLHYQRIIHADIKPGNLLLTECGHVKIADLGVCNEFLGEDATMNNGSTAGTPAFRAPETLIPGQHLYSGKAVDVWALGVTLYSLVFGNVPFVATSVPVLYEKIKNDELVIPEIPKISDELRDCIECMLKKDPDQRITIPQLKEHNWVTSNGSSTLLTEDENCRLIQINDEDINSVVKSIPKLDTLILIKTMLKNHSFVNPFMRGVSGKAPQRGGSRIERFTRAGRSNSAPGAYHLAIDRQLSGDCLLPPLSENGCTPLNEIIDES